MNIEKLYNLASQGLQPRLFVIPKFKFYSPTFSESHLPESESYVSAKVKIVQVGEKKIYDSSNKNNIKTYNHFPVILLHDGQPWEEGNRYLMSLIIKTDVLSTLPSHQQLYRKALSLKQFVEFLVDEEILFKECESRARSPLRRFRFHLNNKLTSGILSPNTIRLVMSNLVQFYRYLIDQEGVVFLYPPWNEKEVYIQNNGKRHVVMSTDVGSVRGRGRTDQQSAAYEGLILDGGKLRPLDKDEQLILFDALKELKNIEMTLVHLHGVLSGARKQTILTYRRNQFLREPIVDQQGMVCLYAGIHNTKGKIADCKDSFNVGKFEKIKVPLELYIKTQVYIKSNRAISRLNKAQNKRPLSNIDDQYIFLSQQGNPFYISKADPYKGEFKTLPNGQALSTFIKTLLIPLLREKGFKKHYKFHDTRATAGMNIVRFGFEELKRKNPSISNSKIFELVFPLVKTRLNHKSLHTTQQYLVFDEKQTIIKQVQCSFEDYLKGLMRI